jgi:competence protein ComEC
MDEQTASTAEGILLGDTSDMDVSLKENFKISSMSHILAVSGMHISYIIIGINLVLKKHLGKRRVRYVIFFILIIYMFLTNFSPSVVRASIMSILLILSMNLHRKNDIWNSLAISLILILVYNPFLILHVGLQLSYLGTIGILILYPNVKLFITNLFGFLRKNPVFYRKIEKLIDKLTDLMSVTIAAQMFILPIILMKFNIFGPYFLISNLCSNFIIAPIIILGIILVLVSLVYLQISKVIAFPFKILIKILIQITNLSNLPFSKIYIPTPRLWQTFLYIIVLLFINFIYHIYNLKTINQTQKRVKNLVALGKYKYRLNKRKNRRVIALIIIFVICILNIHTKHLKINFVDVNQGDCTFIITPKNNTILIDGGGSMSNTFDVGKSILIPYILNKGYTKLDYVIISHYDQDHIRTEF